MSVLQILRDCDRFRLTEQLEPILAALQAANTDSQPILLKISPDLEWEAIARPIRSSKKPTV